MRKIVGAGRPGRWLVRRATAEDSPDKAVHSFLSAAQAGDQKRLAGLLTTAAQAEAQKNGVNFELDSYQNASFQLEQYEF